MIITRFCNFETIVLEIEFITPTFLGGADQSAELRIAPFKNLLRQWWRITNGDLSTDELLKKEGVLFGTTTGDTSTSSKVRLKIIDSKIKTYDKKELMFPSNGINHPEVNNKFIQLEAYLGMGPIFWNNETKKFEYKRTAFLPSSNLKIIVEYPKNELKILETLYCLAEFGTIGSRNRNGWGSFILSSPSTTFAIPKIKDFEYVMTNGKTYPHQLCCTRDGKLLVWDTSFYNDYISVWQKLAELYLMIRTLPIMKNFGNVVSTDNEKQEFLAHETASARHLLGYPLTHHKVNDETWGENKKYFSKPKKVEGRFTSPLRLSIKKKNNQFFGRILHVPYSVHMNFKGNQIKIWQTVHEFLDSQKTLHRMEANS